MMLTQLYPPVYVAFSAAILEVVANELNCPRVEFPQGDDPRFSVRKSPIKLAAAQYPFQFNLKLRAAVEYQAQLK